MRYKLKNKGFSMVELLAAIVILGLLMSVAIVGVGKIMENAKKNYYQSQLKQMKLAGQSYTQDNRNYLPKALGAKSIINLNTLEDKHYIEEVKDYSKQTCDSTKSYVQIFKYSKDAYSYLAHLECPNYNSGTNDETSLEPDITVTFTGTEPTATKSGATIDIKGNSSDEIKILGYKYIVYRNNTEVLNSGEVSAGYRTSKTIKLDLTKYTPSNLKVKVTATNIYGNSKTTTRSLQFADNNPPICGQVTGAGTNWLTNSSASRTITVGCSDEGSGCKQATYSQTFTADTKVGTIKIYDKEDNVTNCKVNVYIDKTAPVINIKAYKKTSAGAKTGNVIKEVTTSNSSRNVTMNGYTNNVNGWLNAANYPDGVYYDVSASDNLSLGDPNKENSNKKWEWNDANLKENASNVNTMTGSSTSNNVSGKSFNASFTLTAAGYRVGKYTVKDEAGNTSVVTVIAAMDRGNPSKPQISNPKYDIWQTAKYSVDVKSTDALSGVYSYDYRYNSSGNFGNMAMQDTVVDNAYVTTGVWNKTGSYTGCLRACDKAKNCGEELCSKIKIDLDDPSIPSSGTLGGVSGTSTTGSVKTAGGGSSDGTSGVWEYRYLIKNNNTTPAKTDSGFNSSKTFTRSCGKSYYAWVIAVDYSGRKSGVHYIGSASDGADSWGAWSKCDGSSQKRTNTCALKGSQTQSCTLKTVKAKTASSSNPIISCPDDQHLPTRDKCVSQNYNKLEIKSVTVSGTKVTVKGNAQNNGYSSPTVASDGKRTICVAKSSNTSCKVSLCTFDISDSSYAAKGAEFCSFNKTFDIKDWDNGDYRAIINGSNDHWRMTTPVSDTPTIFTVSG